ncbi:hypothetical protein [Bosea sp. ANAM02]|uniref:hypothetical protein n=1 Tax=Bosea sp. ANAM02 TaxID=2020412 RepID=UPI00140F2423|nr:hypothetical protein [Bosea sp. ANAM02]BCB19209.1 hypothetical protein OCUBac02_21030 [Bosea sp. ANAM02]
MKIISQAVSGELDVKLSRLTQEECEHMAVKPFLVEVYDDQFCHQTESYSDIDEAQRAFAQAVEAYKNYRS